MKLWSYMAIMIGMIVFLYFLGFPTAGTQDVLSNTGIVIEPTNGTLMTGDVGNSSWYWELFGVTGILVTIFTAGAVIVGLLAKQFDWKIVLLPFFTGVVVKFIGFGWSIVQLARDTGEQWLIAVTATIFLPITVMFVFSIVEWFGVGGSD
jgi:hypothetical protein